MSSRQKAFRWPRIFFAIPLIRGLGEVAAHRKGNHASKALRLYTVLSYYCGVT